MSIGVKAPQETRVLVTGITGFLAGHIAFQLLEQGYRVRGSIRSSQRRMKIEPQLRAAIGANGGELTFFEADLNSDENWAAAVSGCDYVIHTASPFPPSLPKDERELIRTARDGTLRVLRAARQGNVRRVVLTSSVAAVNHGAGQAPYTEADWTDVNSPRATPYYKSKTLAEQDAWSFARTSGLDLVVINPGMILGPLLGPDCGTSVGLIRQFMSGRFPAVPKISFSIVDVRDVANVHLLAMVNPDASGQRFIVGGPSLRLAEIAAVLAQCFPNFARKLPSKEIPNWVVRLMAPISPMSRMIVHELDRDQSVNTEKSRRVLAWHSRPVEEAIRSSAQSLIDMKLITSG